MTKWYLVVHHSPGASTELQPAEEVIKLLRLEESWEWIPSARRERVLRKPRAAEERFPASSVAEVALQGLPCLPAPPSLPCAININGRGKVHEDTGRGKGG